jgi:citrate synthase
VCSLLRSSELVHSGSDYSVHIRQVAKPWGSTSKRVRMPYSLSWIARKDYQNNAEQEMIRNVNSSNYREAFLSIHTLRVATYYTDTPNFLHFVGLDRG